MRKGRVKNKMIWILCSVIVLVIAVIVFFQIPYSPTRSAFQKDVQMHIEQSSAMLSRVFAEQDIAHLPGPVQNHFRVAGLIGQPMMTSTRAFMQSVPLYDAIDKPPMIIDYTLYLFAHKPVRLAYIDTSMFGIPFEGFDSTQDGVGFMKGVIGKIFTLFNETGPEMDKGQLMTILGEAPLLPSVLLSEYITWEHIDENHARATLTYKGITGSGVYTFDDTGFLQSFYTDERAKIGTDGSIDFIGWSAVVDNWERNENGIYTPNTVKAIWHLTEGDLVYFEANGFIIEFGYQTKHTEQ